MIDDVRITVKAGDGGDGKVSFRRLKFLPKGGPDGGDGGAGGSVYLVGNKDLNTLSHFMGKKRFAAKPGGSGGGNNCHGKNGENIEVAVPLGTVVNGTDEVLKHGERLLVARGGRGGRGNDAFKSSKNQTPMVAEKGQVGEEKNLHLELKLLANIGLVGLPNAGKSTLLSVLTRARPAIGDYPFTTLSPNLGVMVGYGGTSLVLADIPGLIEGAGQGKGLGHEFLRHVERCSVLVFVLSVEEHTLFDAALCEHDKAETVIQQYVLLRKELKEFHPDLLKKKVIVGLNKCDLYSESLTKRVVRLFKDQDIAVIPFSAATHDGVEKLRETLLEVG